MPGLTNAEAKATLDARFPVAAATDFIAYSLNGSSEWAGLVRTNIGAAGWAAATTADPSVKANNAVLTSATTTGGGTVTHFAIFSASTGGTQRTEWTAFAASRVLNTGDVITHAIGAIAVTLT